MTPPNEYAPRADQPAGESLSINKETLSDLDVRPTDADAVQGGGMMAASDTLQVQAVETQMCIARTAMGCPPGVIFPSR